MARKIKEQIESFCEKLSEGLRKDKKRFLKEMIFGIQAARDVKLSNISRSLGEKIKLIKTENRLSRQIKGKDLTERVNKILIEEGSWRIESDTVLALDLSDISKPYAKKMEYLDHVWNGSEGKTDKGYWLCEVIGAGVKSDMIMPLYSKIYSSGAREFVSGNEEIKEAMQKVSEGTKGRGIFVIDRGGDRSKILENIEELSVKFVIRMTSKRNIKSKTGEEKNILKYAEDFYCKDYYKINIDRDGIMEEREIKLGKARITINSKEYTLGIIKGFGKEPMMLLTNVDKGAKDILEIYLTRWKCEEGFRFLKQEYHLEDVRVRSYVGIKNTMSLLQAVFYFISVRIGKRMKMNILLKKILEKAKRFFEEPVFKQYAIADGIYRVLFNTKCAFNRRLRPEDQDQMEMDFAFEV
jgi:hypothetical protein